VLRTVMSSCRTSVSFRIHGSVGILLIALVVSLTHVDVASATSHCTHYTPPYGQDTSGGCSELYSLPTYGFNTTGYALRDDNVIAQSPKINTICVWYIDRDTLNNYDTTCFYATSVSIGVPSSGYAYSACEFYSIPTLGVCETTWHT